MNMDITRIRQNIELLPDVIFDLEKKYLESKAQLSHMNDLSKHILAKLKTQFTGSNADREQHALATEGYCVHLDGILEQEKIVADLAAKFHMEERRFEAMRSLNKNV
jgi:hypothetical protein